MDRSWRGTMMANSARDPYWQASVRAETIAAPHLKGVIEDKCATCHMPMARTRAHADGSDREVLDDGFLDPAHPLHEAAMDGVSCSLCHQIQPTDLGQSASYSGGYVIDLETAMGEREVFGPYVVDEDQSRIMIVGSGFVPVQALHLGQSEMCASCHTLYTPYLDASGEVVGEFPEQMVYFEWFYSDYNPDQTCQSCHMPPIEGGAFIASTSPVPRLPFAVHDMVGGNAYMISIFREFGEDLGVTASDDDFEYARERILEQMGSRTASLRLEDVARLGQSLVADVLIESEVGHKFPSGFPSRRTWLHFVVRDGAGEVVFESGAVTSDGVIIGNDNDADPRAYEPHYSLITRADEVQIYEAILQDTSGQVTTELLRAAIYRKDNRLLPLGFDAQIPYVDIAVRGEATEDEDFAGGGDLIRYSVPVGDVQGPLTLTVELLYQSIGYRWAENLRAYDAAEVSRFLRYYESVPNLPLVIDSVSLEVE
jgi:hypothetical protein